MPKLVDYAGRYEFLRQAAFAVVRDRSVAALTRRSMAAELGCGTNTVRRLVAAHVEPVVLAADEVVTRRRRGRIGRRSDDPLEVVDYLVRSLMPEDDLHLDEEMVWWRLLAACSFRASGLEQRWKVRYDFEVAQRGFADAEELAERAEREERAAPAQWAARDALAPCVEQRDEVVQAAVGRILDLLEVPEPREVTMTMLVAVLDGLTLAACLGRLSAARATELAVAHVRTLQPDAHGGTQ